MSCSLSTVEANLPPGFRFHPKDEELICDYLMNWVSAGGSCSHQITPPLLIQVDLNKCEPWDIPEAACVGGKEWYFYSQRDKKYSTGIRTNRATISGYWKATGKDRPVLRNETLVGMRKTLVFYQGRAPKGGKTEWVMHEFRLEEPGPKTASSPKEDWVICKVFNKNKSSSEIVGSGYDDTTPLTTQSYNNFTYNDQVNHTISPNDHRHYQQVPCFSISTPGQTSPNNNSLPATIVDPGPPITPNNINGSGIWAPQIQNNNNLYSNESNRDGQDVLKDVYINNHAIKMESVANDQINNVGMMMMIDGPRSFEEGGSDDSYMSKESPFTPKASVIRYWKTQISNDLPKPEFLLKKASLLTAAQYAAFSKLAADQNKLSEKLPDFCSTANLLCFPDLSQSLEKHSDVNFSSCAQDLNFTNYSTNQLGGSDAFLGSVRRYSRGSTAHDDNFNVYATKDKVVDQSFNTYGKMVNNKWSVEPVKFFKEAMLKNGSTLPMPGIRDKMPQRSFLPRVIVSKLPFSTSKITEMKKIFRVGEDGSGMSKMMIDALADYERAPSARETKRCVASIEDMIDFVTSVLGRNVVVRSMNTTQGYNRKVMLGNVKGVNGGQVTKFVSCHQSLFPYMLYYCHSVPKVRVYEADILDPNTNEKINHGVAINLSFGYHGLERES
ncbi:hypothetical protein CASFOL_040525 [Castilleja foliolosa]|uniref:NAC domain-containing protein n=1 Tax=Castilleja foliolosa TaxID=1961234 RepID=A0ABD3BC73_9LAMI